MSSCLVALILKAAKQAGDGQCPGVSQAWAVFFVLETPSDQYSVGRSGSTELHSGRQKGQ